MAVEIPSKPPGVPACRDRPDLPFLYLTAAGKADTGDRDLLALVDQLPYRVITADAFAGIVGVNTD